MSIRIQYKIIEGAKTYSGTRIIDVELDAYMQQVHKSYPEASYVYLEFVEDIEDTITADAITIILP